MAISLATGTQNAMLSAVAARADADTGGATIKVYTGSKPANANGAPTGTLLLTYTLNVTAFTSPVAGAVDVASLPLAATGAANGTAGWWRLADESGDTVLDGTAGADGSGEDIELSTTTVTVGLVVNMISGTLTQPAG